VWLPKETFIRIQHRLVEGTSVHATARPCHVQPKTVLSMLTLAGENCEKIMGRRLVVNVPVQDGQLDEIWG
jgi:hypothetical protein